MRRPVLHPDDQYWHCPQHALDSAGYGVIHGEWVLPDGSLGRWRVDDALALRVAQQHIPAVPVAPPSYRPQPWGEDTMPPTQAITSSTRRLRVSNG